MEINQEKFIEIPKEPVAKAKSKKKSSNSKNLIILFVLIVITAGVVLFLFNLMKEPQQQIETIKKEIVEENKKPIKSHTPPKLTTENTIFDTEAIEAKKSEPTLSEKDQEPTLETNNTIDELSNIEIPTVDNLVKQTREVVVTSNQSDLGEQKEPPITDNFSKINSTFEALKKEAVIKTNFFNFRGKNYYEGDIIENIKIKEVTTKTIKVEFDNKIEEISR